MSARAVALMIASDVIVAPVVASTPFTPCFSMILAGVSASAVELLFLVIGHTDGLNASALNCDFDGDVSRVTR